MTTEPPAIAHTESSRHSSKYERRAIGISTASIVLTVLVAIVAAVPALFSFFGWTSPGAQQAHQTSELEFMRAFDSKSAASARLAIGFTSAGSDAEFAATLRYRSWIGFESADDRSKGKPFAVRLTQSGDQIRECDNHKLCDSVSNFVFDGSGRIKTYSVDGIPLRQLILRPLDRAAQSSKGVSATFMGALVSIGGKAMAGVFEVRSEQGTTTLATDGTLSLNVKDETHYVGFLGQSPLTQQQPSWVYASAIPVNATWVKLIARNSEHGTVAFWFPLS